MNMIKYAAVLFALYGNFENVDAMRQAYWQESNFLSKQKSEAAFNPQTKSEQLKAERSNWWNNCKENMSEYEANKICGKPQYTSPGHASCMAHIAQQCAGDPRVTSVYLNKTLSTITEGQVDSPKRPDVAYRTMDGTITLLEVRSPSEKLEEQLNKVTDMCNLAPGLFDQKNCKVCDYSAFPKTSPYRPNERRKPLRVSTPLKLDNFFYNCSEF